MSANRVTRSESGIDFETEADTDMFPMYAVNFSDYLDENNLRIEDIATIVFVAIAYDEAGEEIDFSFEYQKCAFVSEEALDGYSDSDILPKGNYKVFGSGLKTKIDLTSYTGFKADGTGLTDSSLEDGVGFNVQILNGEVKRVRHFVITKLVFCLDE